MEMLRAEAMPGSKGLTRLHLEMRLPCPVWGAVNVTGPVRAWSLAAEPPEVRRIVSHGICPDKIAGVRLAGRVHRPYQCPSFPHCLEMHASFGPYACTYQGS